MRVAANGVAIQPTAIAEMPTPLLITGMHGSELLRVYCSQRAQCDVTASLC